MYGGLLTIESNLRFAERPRTSRHARTRCWRCASVRHWARATASAALLQSVATTACKRPFHAPSARRKSPPEPVPRSAIIHFYILRNAPKVRARPAPRFSGRGISTFGRDCQIQRPETRGGRSDRRSARPAARRVSSREESRKRPRRRAGRPRAHTAHARSRCNASVSNISAVRVEHRLPATLALSPIASDGGGGVG